MKKSFSLLPFILIALTLTAFGCQKFGGASPKVNVPDGWATYKNTDYNFSLSYPEKIEVNQRSVDNLAATYVGLSGKFFISIRDTEREDGVATLAQFYAFSDVSVEQFSEGLVASDPGSITIKETTEVEQGGIAMKKIVSTTALGVDKIHYLFERGGNLIVVSIVLGEEEAFAPIFETVVAGK